MPDSGGNVICYNKSHYILNNHLFKETVMSFDLEMIATSVAGLAQRG